MKRYKNSIFYLGTIGIFSVVIYWTIVLGSSLREKGENIPRQNGKGHWDMFADAIVDNLQHPLALLLAQIITIIFAARILGWVCIKLRQPVVIGEMIAGIVLGPSVIGLYFPDFSATLFPAHSLGNLQFLSQIGLILFMYIVGMELDIKVLRNKAHEAVVISHASIIIPFALGVVLSYFIFAQFAPAGVDFISFSLFIGIAMSITAFPVLARIIQERGLQKTRLGTIVITCAAADDITAWCLLAAVIAIVKAGTFVTAVYTILLAVLYVLLMIKVVRPFLKRIGQLHPSRETLSKSIIAIFFLVLIISSYLTEIIGIHALFGAFMAGAIMPDSKRFRDNFIEKVEDVALALLLPLFFVFTGLRTQIGLLDDPYLWRVTAIIILVAVAGKFLGSALAAKVVGQSWRDSLTIGALMNTRGLMELVVLNIGYDLGVLGPEIFAMMVIMALVTTVMTGPALDIINRLFRTKEAPPPVEIKEETRYKVLFYFESPEDGKSLLRLGHGLTNKLKGNAALTAMYVSSTEGLHHLDMEEYEGESFKEVVAESAKLSQPVTTLFKASSDVNTEIINVANKGRFDLLLVGLGESIYEGSLLGKVLGFTSRIINPEVLLNTVTGKESIFDNSPFDDRTKFILSKAQMPVGILVDKQFTQTDRVFIPYFENNDSRLIEYAQKLIHNSGSQVVVLDVAGSLKNNAEVREHIRRIERIAPNHITIRQEKTIGKEFLQQQDLMIISLESWKKLVDSKSLWISDTPSTLIIA
ncbi:MAG TPA: cation:proton antiporter [Chitinophagaceae bacterium]|nr:cation:proton antiporter [Chitinophagaceae bacterium]